MNFHIVCLSLLYCHIFTSKKRKRSETPPPTVKKRKKKSKEELAREKALKVRNVYPMLSSL